MKKNNKYKYILFLKLTFITLFFLYTTLLYAETFYKWVDKDGILQYSNKPPKDYKKNDPNVAVIEGVQKLSKEGAFTIKEQDAEKNLIQFIPDETWDTEFSSFNKKQPDLPESKESSLKKLNKIIADETILLESIVNNYQNYLIDYTRRKKQYKEETKKHKEKIELKIWRQLPVESEDNFLKNKSIYEEKIKYQKLLIRWAKYKKEALESN